MRSLLAMLLAFASAASAEGLDRDTLLTDAPAVPAVGTVRVTGAGVATQNTDNGATPTGSSSFTGTSAPTSRSAPRAPRRASAINS